MTIVVRPNPSNPSTSLTSSSSPSFRSTGSTPTSQSQRPSPLTRSTTLSPAAITQAVPPSEEDIVDIIEKQSLADDHSRKCIPNIDEALYDRVQTRIGFRNRALRYYYDVESRSIIIDTVASKIHESVQNYLTYDLRIALQTWLSRVIPGAELEIDGQVVAELYNEVGLQVKGKVPDQAYRVYTDSESEPRRYPNVVVEVGYSESRVYLIDDARRWLLYTHEDPVLSVIIIWFNEPKSKDDFGDISKWSASLEVYERYKNFFN